MLQSTLTLSLLALTGGLFQVTNAQNQTESIQIENDNPDFRVCGVNYTEVLDNCSTNPPCPTGDRCPVGYTCFQLNEKLCPPKTSAPTAEQTAAPTTLPPAPAPAFKICATGFSQAASLCFDSTVKDCATCNNVTEACFTVAPELCTDGNIDAPTSPQTAPPTAAPTALPKPTPSPTMSVAPTKAPTPNRFFCATNWDTVDENCSTATPCPNGQQDCASTGMNCYEIQADKCVGQTNPVDTGSSETEGSSAQLIDPPISTPSATVSVRVCAKDLIEATFNCATNTPCPDGSSASCASGEACIPVDSCNKSSEMTDAPTQASQLSFATAAPVPSPTGENATASPVASSTEWTQSPSGTVGFIWATPAPNGSNILHVSSVLQSFLVGLIFLGAAMV